MGWSQTLPLPSPLEAQDETQTSLRHAVDEICAARHASAQYDYIMTVRVRLLLFWAGKDDVGGGYVRCGVSVEDSPAEFFQILMGSDPAKAPGAINRWGAAAERVQRSAHGGALESSTFFGFMKVYKGNSPAEMCKELDGEKQGGTFLYSSILNQSNRNGSVAKTVPFASATDFDFNQLDQVEPVVFDRLEDSAGKIRGTSATTLP